MSANKKNNNGWILCPSKSFPGKFYYFNVLNGEAAWSLNEAEKKFVKKGSTIQKIADKSHCYPEPNSPPIDESPNTSSPICLNYIKQDLPNARQTFVENKVNHTPIPEFGQAVFPKYISNLDPYMPNVIWTPIPVSSSLFFPSEVKKQTLDQVTQTCDPDKQILVQTCTKPLCKRFVNYEKPILNFNKDNKIENKNALSKFYNSTRIKCTDQIFNSKWTNSHDGQIKSDIINNDIHTRPLIKEPMLKNLTISEKCNKPDKNNSYECFGNIFSTETKRVRRNSESFEGVSGNIQVSDKFNLSSKIAPNYCIKEMNKVRRHSFTTVDLFENQSNTTENNKSHCINMPSISCDDHNQTKICNLKLQNSNIGSSVKYECNRIQDITENKDLVELGRNDLRLLLVARKRKSADKETYNMGSIEGKRIKTTYCEETRPVAPKKRVTFNLRNQCYDKEDQTETFSATSEDVNTNNPDIKCLRNHECTVGSECWYIVADTDALLEDFDFINNLVQSDDNCRLLIPHAVRSDIEALTSGDSRGRQRVLLARQIARRLAVPPRHCVVQTSDQAADADIMLTIECILKCCLEVMHQNHHVVLITNDPELKTRAISLNVHCYKMNEIKKKPDVTFDLKKIQVTIKNTNKPEENLFLQKDFNPHLVCNRAEIPVNCVKQRFFDDFSEEKSDKLIDITKPKCPINITEPINNCTVGYESDTTGTSIEIGRNIQRLNLRDGNIFKSHKEIRNSNYNKTQNVFDIQKSSNGQMNLLSYQKETRNNDVNNHKTIFDNYNQVLNSNENREFHFQNNNDYNKVSLQNCYQNEAFEIRRQVPNSKYQNIDPINKVTSLFFQNDSKQVTFDFRKHTRNDFREYIPNSNQDPEQIFEIQNVREPVLNAGNVSNKYINELSMESKLKRFYVKNRETEERIMARIDEWICCFTQIIEYALSDVLQDSPIISDDCRPPWTLNEGIQYVKMTYSDNDSVSMVVDKLSNLIARYSTNKGSLSSNIEPNDFMKIIGCGILLMQALMTILPNHQELTEAVQSLNNIIRLLEDPTLDPKLPQCSPVWNRVERSEVETRQNFVKEPLQIIKYLKKHYEQWSSYNEITDELNYLKRYSQSQTKRNEDAKVVRTFGKNLGLLKIDNCKSLTMGKPANSTNETDGLKVMGVFENEKHVSFNKTIPDVGLNMPVIDRIENASAGPKMVKDLENVQRSQTETKEKDADENTIFFYNFNVPKHGSTIVQKENKPEPNVILKLDNINKFSFRQMQEKTKHFAAEDLNVSTHENTFKHDEAKNGPKVIRKIKLIDAFEERLKNKPTVLDSDVLDYSSVSNDGEISQHTITNQSHSESMEDVISDLKMSNDSDLNIKSDGTGNEDSVLNNNSYSENNNTVSGNNNIDSRNNNGDSSEDNVNSRNNNASYCSENNMPKLEAQLLNKNALQIALSNECISVNERILRRNDSECQNDAPFLIHNNDDLTNDSGIEHDHAYPLAKSFFTQLSISLKMIHNFIDKSVKDLRSKEIRDAKKNLLHGKASKTYQCLGDIINKLKSIIHREATGGTALKDLLVRAGVDGLNDKRMTKYRQIVKKCLEQAQVLRNALKILLAVTDTDFDGTTSFDAESISSSIRFLNIFE